MKTIIQTILIFIFFAVLTGLVYPLLITGISQLVFNKQANGSLIIKDNKIIGSELIGQLFTNDSYFQGRPSANNYDATNSGGYNLGPASSNLIATVSNRVETIRIQNSLSTNILIPPDMVLSSASGLDPDISVDNAKIQALRIAKARKITVGSVLSIIQAKKESPFLGFWETEKVNVLKLNMALDQLKKE